ncbi:MAG: DUF3365 domain-containing protein [Candidatus Zixiibacteriota bacterium]
MKLLICCLMAVTVISGCGAQDTETAPAAQSQAQAPAPDEAELTAAARNLAGQFGRDLQSALLGALNENGPAYAMQVCQIRAGEIAAAHSAAGWSVKRVSDKWRNITGRPDSAEVAVLATFADLKTDSEFLTRWSGPDSARVFNYYQTIVVREMCLQCHGDLQSVDLDLWQQVKIAYPYDKATGYKEGDLRGMFVVSAHLPEAEKIAPKLAEGIPIGDLVAKDTTSADTTAKQ